MNFLFYYYMLFISVPSLFVNLKFSQLVISSDSKKFILAVDEMTSWLNGKLMKQLGTLTENII
jgi:hypothetical protein